MKLFEKKIDLSVPQDINLLVEELKSLREKGFGEATVLIESPVKINFSSEGIDEKIFEEIKKKQELPEWVVYDLFKTQGAISDNKSFGKVDNFE